MIDSVQKVPVMHMEHFMCAPKRADLHQPDQAATVIAVMQH